MARVCAVVGCPRAILVRCVLAPRRSCVRDALNNSATASLHYTFLVLFVRLIVSVAHTSSVPPPPPPPPYVLHRLACCRNKT